MSLLVKARREGRDIVRVTPQSAGWRYVGFSAHRLAAGESMTIDQPGDELCIVVLGGTVTVGSATATAWRDIGERRDVFDDARAVRGLSAARRRGVEVRAHTAAEIGVASAPGPGSAPARADRAGADEALRARQRARTSASSATSCRRPSRPSHLLVVEVRTPSGHSSSYPPHKHDTDNLPQESSLEETYYHRLQPGAGLRVPARLHRRPLARRIAGRRGPRRRDGAARLPSGRRALRLRIVLPERDGGAEARMAFPQRPGARMDAESAEPHMAADATRRTRMIEVALFGAGRIGNDPRRQHRAPARRPAASTSSTSTRGGGASARADSTARRSADADAVFADAARRGRRHRARRPTRTPISSCARRRRGKAIFCEKPVDLDARARARLRRGGARGRRHRA